VLFQCSLYFFEQCILKAITLPMIFYSTFKSDTGQNDPYDNGSLSLFLSRVIVAKHTDWGSTFFYTAFVNICNIGFSNLGQRCLENSTGNPSLPGDFPFCSLLMAPNSSPG
jgi:hypothetical protein